MHSSRVTATALLALSIGYGVVAWRLEVDLPTAAGSWGPRTFPLFLAAVGSVLALLLLRGSAELATPNTTRNNHRTTAGLLAWMVLYAVGIPWIGLLAATTVFLAGAFIALGEKRPSVAVPVALAVASAFQLLLSRGLGLWIDDPILRLLGLQ